MKRISTFVSSALVQELRCCSPTSSAYTGALDIHTAIQIHKPARCFPRCFLHSLSTLVYYEWMVTNASEFINDIKIWGSLGCRDRALVEFTVLRDMGKESIVRTLIFRKAKFQLFKELVNRIPWETVIKDRWAEQSWQIFKDAFHRTQELSVPRCKKSVKEVRRPTWLSQDLLVKLKSKRELHRQWRQGKVSQEEH